MSQLPIEECPICWRTFSNTAIPVTITCGHSFCDDCSTGLRKCPLCRRKLAYGYQRITNYSLLSQVGRIEQANQRETKHQEVQTDFLCSKPRPRRQPIRSEVVNTGHTSIIPGQKNQVVVLKLQPSTSNCFSRLEIRFK